MHFKCGFRFLIDNPVIEELDISFNAVLVAGAESLAEAIMQSKSLTALDLRSNNIGAVGMCFQCGCFWSIIFW